MDLPSLFPAQPVDFDNLKDPEFQIAPGVKVPYYSPQNKSELRFWLKFLFGYLYAPEVHPDCKGKHQAPLDAIAAAYFADSSIVLWHAARRFGGKSTALTAICRLEWLDGADVNLLAATNQQAKNNLELVTHNYFSGLEIQPGVFVNHPIRVFAGRKPTKLEITGKNGNRLRSLSASTMGARGPHPQRLRIDEVDEMDHDVYRASTGQAAIKPSANVRSKIIRDQTLVCSTLQYPDGTMAKILKEAQEKKWPTYHWCYKESLEEIGGWLTWEEVERKKIMVLDADWQQEYELDEPLVADRLFGIDLIDRIFPGEEYVDQIGKRLIFEAPVEGATYVHGIDWARDEHYTVIVTLRTDVRPIRLVAYERVNQQNYRLQIEKVRHRFHQYQGPGFHDGIGVGAGLGDMLDDVISLKPWTLRKAEVLFTPYVSAIEDELVRYPHIETLYDEHRYLRGEVLYLKDFDHTPDTFYACSLAYQAHLQLVKTFNKKRVRLGKPILLPSHRSIERNANRDMDSVYEPGMKIRNIGDIRV